MDIDRQNTDNYNFHNKGKYGQGIHRLIALVILRGC